MVFRVYVEKKPGFDVEAQQLAGELRTILGLTGLKALRIVNRYDVEGISQELFDQTVPTVFSEPQVDNVAYDLPTSPAPRSSPPSSCPASSTSAPTPPPNASSSSPRASARPSAPPSCTRWKAT